ncbi:MAG: glycosyl hydrolase [Gemmatimonadetes bacterium]|nr:glycosyl hydrolase [Gemmatimonadota bacterium]NNF14370.1 glycosyl hydrolase [Gemmatimonadota bacterium]
MSMTVDTTPLVSRVARPLGQTVFAAASLAAVVLHAALAQPAPLEAQARSVDAVLDSVLLADYQWRNIGPDRGGRSIAVSGVVGQPEVGYFGATGGGLWKTTDGGENWFPVTDFQISSASVGAVAVSETNPDLVFIGTGESCIRGNILPGDGVYRSRDAGQTWQHVGFDESHAISKIRIHPTNPDVIYVASFGKYSAPSEERGVFRSTDGGDTWERVLHRNDETGAVDLVLDRNDPDVLYAALWEAFRKEYTASSGGPGSGMFKSTDGGDSWTEMTRNSGMPQEGVVGRIGLAVSSADSDRVYALFEHDEGGLFRSDDAGASWERVNDERRIRQRAFYYTHVFADHQDPDVVYMQNTRIFRSTDGGETLEVIDNGTHGDHHDLWIDPDDPAHLIDGNDGGGAVSFVTGQEWTDQEFSTAQFYQAVTTAHVPFHVCGSQQDNSTLCLPSDWNAGRLGDDDVNPFAGQPNSITEGSMEYAYVVGGGEPGYIAPDPKDLDIFFSGTNNGRYLDKYNKELDTRREVSPYPWFYSGEPALEMVERWQWTFPILFSPLDSDVLFTSSNRLWRTDDGGNSWDQLSPDLTRADPMTLGRSGGPITGDMNGPEVYATIFAVGPGKVDMDVIWTGSDDGLVHVTRDGGENWTDVTPPDMPDFGRVSQIDASAFAAGGAYISVRKPLLDDFRPYVWKTSDYGATWTKIVDGIRDDAYVNAVREDPNRQGLLYAGTNHGVYVSFDDGSNWQELNPGFPDLPVTNVVVEHNELAIASHGRGFWVLDNLEPIRQAERGMTNEAVRLFDPPAAFRSTDGVVLSYWLREEATEARLEVVSLAGEVLRTFEPALDADEEGEEQDRWSGAALPVEAGLNTLRWDLSADGWTAFPRMILWGVRTNTPTLPPGEYTLRLTVDGQVETSPLEIRRHPWIEDVSDEDMRAQFDFATEIRDRVEDANQAVIAIRRMRTQVIDRTEASDDGELRERLHELMTAAGEVEADIYQVRNRSGQDPLNFPIKVNNRLANLLSMVEQGDGAPNDGMREVYDIMSDELQGYLDALEAVWATELEAANDRLSELGLDELDPFDEETEIWAPSGM